jgi:hypothetical protein
LYLRLGYLDVELVAVRIWRRGLISGFSGANSLLANGMPLCRPVFPKISAIHGLTCVTVDKHVSTAIT